MDRSLTYEEAAMLFQVGDQFWTITSAHTEPVGIEGPYTVLGSKSIMSAWDDDKERLVYSLSYVSKTGKVYMCDHYLGDLVNCWHGVFLTKEEAEAEFARRREKLKNDWQWQQEIKHEK